MFDQLRFRTVYKNDLLKSNSDVLDDVLLTLLSPRFIKHMNSFCLPKNEYTFQQFYAILREDDICLLIS